MWSLRNHGGYTLLMQFCSMTSPALSARCIYLLMFKKICSQINLCSRLDRYSSHQNQGVWKCWYFSLNLTPSENGRRGFKKKRGFKGSFALVIKRPCLLIFTCFVCCYLRQLHFGMYTVSNFSYSLKSISATYAHLFNTEKNRSSIEKLRLWVT